MTPEQQRVHDAVISGPRGQMIGPLRAAIHSPELAERWSRLGEFLRYNTCLPARVTELAIIVTGRRWTSQVEWWVHARVGLEAGLPQDAVDAIRDGAAPVFDDAGDAAVYEFARRLQQEGKPDLESYRAVERHWGARGVVELTAVIGYYTLVAMTLNAHEIPLPEGVEPPLAALSETGLATLPAARIAADQGA